jgi:hypothetical protein
MMQQRTYPTASLGQQSAERLADEPIRTRD